MAGNGQDRVVSDEERARAMLEQLKSVHAVDIGRDMVIAAVNFSYPKLGLSDETRAVRDLDDVRLTIELIRGLLEVLDRDHADATSDLHDTLAQMQIAYAHAVQLANAERAAEREAEAHEGGAAAAEPEAAAQAEPVEEPQEPQEPAAEAPSVKKKPAAKKPASKKPAAKKKPAARKKPAGES
jgi:outer membrane biosynthesis protein TonB